MKEDRQTQTPESSPAKPAAVTGQRTGKLSIGALIRGTGVYAGSSALASLISFGLVFIFARYLSTSDYGLVATASAIQGVLMLVIMLDLPSAIGREYFADDKPSSHFSGYFGTSVSTVMIWGCLIMAFILLAPSRLFSGILSVDRWVVVAAGIAGFAGAIYLFQMVVWQMSNQPLPYGAITVAQVLLSGVVGLVAVVGFHQGAAGRIWSLAFANVVIALIILPRMRTSYNLRWRIEKNHLRKSLAFSLPLLPHDLSAWIMSLADRLLLSNLATLAITGTYSVGVALCGPISLVADGFGRAWVPFVYGALNEGTEKAKQEIVAIGKITVLMVTLGGLTIALFAPDIVSIVLPKSYFDSATVIPVVGLALVANAMYRVFIVPMYHVKKTSLIFWSTVCGAVANVLCNILLIPRFAGLGAAWSSFLAILVQISLAMIICQKTLYLPWGIRFFIPLFLSAFISIFLPVYILSSFFLKILAIFLFFLSMFTPLHLSNHERKMVVGLLTHLKQRVLQSDYLKLGTIRGTRY